MLQIYIIMLMQKRTTVFCLFSGNQHFHHLKLYMLFFKIQRRRQHAARNALLSLSFRYKSDISHLIRNAKLAIASSNEYETISINGGSLRETIGKTTQGMQTRLITDLVNMYSDLVLFHTDPCFQRFYECFPEPDELEYGAHRFRISADITAK